MNLKIEHGQTTRVETIIFPGVEGPLLKYMSGKEAVYYCLHCQPRPTNIDSEKQIIVSVAHDACLNKRIRLALFGPSSNF
jgi:hypothetical protein